MSPSTGRPSASRRPGRDDESRTAPPLGSVARPECVRGPGRARERSRRGRGPRKSARGSFVRRGGGSLACRRQVGVPRAPTRFFDQGSGAALRTPPPGRRYDQPPALAAGRSDAGRGLRRGPSARSACFRILTGRRFRQAVLHARRAKRLVSHARVTSGPRRSGGVRAEKRESATNRSPAARISSRARFGARSTPERASRACRSSRPRRRPARREPPTFPPTGPRPSRPPPPPWRPAD